jgi:hypothetical protein
MVLLQTFHFFNDGAPQQLSPLTHATAESIKWYNLAMVYPSTSPLTPMDGKHQLRGSGPCIVKVEQQFSFAFLDKWIYF